MGLLEDIDEDRLDTSPKLLRATIPGYDYRKKDSRRETDRALREKIRTDLTQIQRRLDDIQDILHRQDQDEPLTDVADLKDQISHLKDSIEASGSGGGILTGLTDAGENDYIDLIEHDAALINAIEDTTDETEMLFKRITDGLEDPGPRLQQLRADLRDLEDRIDKRQDFLTGL